MLIDFFEVNFILSQFVGRVNKISLYLVKNIITLYNLLMDFGG